MNLDMEEIDKLNPPGLHNLRPMLVVVEVITGLIAKEVSGSRMMLKLVRALGRYQKQARDNEAYNLNVKIKAWVLAQAERRAWVRGILGEAAIRRWQMRYDNLAHPVALPPKRRSKPRSAPASGILHYNWKRFALADLSWLETRPMARLDTTMPTSSGGWLQSREARGFKPVEFYPFELTPDYEPPEYLEQNLQEPKADTDDPTITKPDPPPKRGVGMGEKHQDPEKKPEIDKPP